MSELVPSTMSAEDREHQLLQRELAVAERDAALAKRELEMTKRELDLKRELDVTQRELAVERASKQKKPFATFDEAEKLLSEVQRQITDAR